MLRVKEQKARQQSHSLQVVVYAQVHDFLLALVPAA